MERNKKTVTISRESELGMLVMLVGTIRSNPHKHKQAINSADIVTEALQDLDEIRKRLNIVVNQDTD